MSTGQDIQYIRYVLEIMEMWWLIGKTPDFWGRGPWFRYDPDALEDHCVTK